MCSGRWSTPYRSPMQALLRPALEDRIDARDAGGGDTWTVDRSVVGLVGRHVDAACRLVRRNAGGMELRRLLPKIAQVRLEPVDALLAGERLPVAGDYVDEIERAQAIERGRPLVDVAVDEIRDLVDEQVAGAHDALLRQIHDDVPGGVAVAEIQEANLAVAAEQRDAIVHRDVR